MSCFETPGAGGVASDATRRAERRGVRVVRRAFPLADERGRGVVEGGGAIARARRRRRTWAAAVQAAAVQAATPRGRRRRRPSRVATARPRKRTFRKTNLFHVRAERATRRRRESRGAMAGFPPAAQPDIIRAHQKDEVYVRVRAAPEPTARPPWLGVVGFSSSAARDRSDPSSLVSRPSSPVDPSPLGPRCCATRCSTPRGGS